MRFYVYTPARPGYISAEVAVRELSDEHEARAWASDTWAHNGRTIISRAEAFMVPTYRNALERWERRDDATLQDTETAQIRREWRDDAAAIADLGCSEATAALAADDDEAIHAVVSEHGHDVACGGRYYQDEQRPRRLHAVT